MTLLNSDPIKQLDKMTPSFIKILSVIEEVGIDEIEYVIVEYYCRFISSKIKKMSFYRPSSHIKIDPFEEVCLQIEDHIFDMYLDRRLSLPVNRSYKKNETYKSRATVVIDGMTDEEIDWMRNIVLRKLQECNIPRNKYRYIAKGISEAWVERGNTK